MLVSTRNQTITNQKTIETMRNIDMEIYIDICMYVCMSVFIYVCISLFISVWFWRPDTAKCKLKRNMAWICTA